MNILVSHPLYGYSIVMDRFSHLTMIYHKRAQAATFTTGISTMTTSYIRFYVEYPIYIIHRSSEYLYTKFRHGFSRTDTLIGPLCPPYLGGGTGGPSIILR